MSTSAGVKASLAKNPASSGGHGGRLLQRKCSCGGTKSGVNDSCDECRRRRLQRKVAVGASDDRLELEADRIAERILTTNAAAPPGPVEVQRASSTASGPSGFAAPTSVDSALAGAGQPLEPWLRHDMENRFGHDFSDVRIHLGAVADRSARDVEAMAYTVGSNIVFGAGQFAPATETGRRLLAHELTHVLQQRESASPARVQRQPRRSEASGQSGGATVTVVSLPTEIFWSYFWFQKSPAALNYAQLEIHFATLERSQQYTAKWIADRSVEALESGTGLKFKAGKRDKLLAYLKEQFSQVRAQDMTLSIDMFDQTGEASWSTFFEERSLESQLAEAAGGMKEQNGWVYTIVAKGNLGTDPTPEGNDIPVDVPGDREVAAALAREAAKQHQRLEATIEGLRRLDTPPPNLPDRVVLWQSERDQLWYLNVWILLDTAGKKKKGMSVRLEPGESTADLLKRVQAAVDKTRETMRQDEDERRLLAMPPWAVKLKEALQERLGPKKGGTVPDGLSLVFENEGARTNGPISSKAPSNELPRVLLQVSVERSGRRNSASVPLLEQTNLDELEKYVRHLTAMLRQFEKAPDSMELTRWDLSGADDPMPPFKARIVPQDLRPDKVTIAGGNNKFGMLLNYEEQFQSGGAGQEMADMHVASKLYSQTIFFIWRVFKVPADVQPNTDEKPAPTEWKDRWEWLYKHYNPGATISGDTISWTDTTRPMPLPPSPEVTTTESSFVGQLVSPLAALATARHAVTRDPSGRVRMEEAEGEYLVFCETRHRPFGEYDLERQPAYAYYPLRTESKETIVGPLVTETVQEIETARKEIAAIDAALTGGKIDEARRPLLQALRSSAQSHLDVLQTKETSGLVKTTAAEIEEGKKKLGLVTKLRERLPGLVATAKANQENHTEPDSPSKMLADTPDQLVIYWQLIQEQKTVEGYEKELIADIAELEKVNERARDYSSKFKPDAACIYSPEAVFVSEVDGNIYPLVLEIGEAQPIFPGETAYTVADLTTEQTKDNFRGKSHKPGDDGHVAAIDDAFDEFGSKATYGEGWIGVRMPQGPSEETCRDRHHPGIKFYRSKEGIIEKVWKILGLLAAVIGVAALVATGVGAPAAAALLGAAAGIIGAAVSLHNISERQRKGTLKADAELALDILGVLGVGELAASAKLASMSRAVRGFDTFERLGKFIAVYRVSSEGATAILIPLKLDDDISRIKALHLAPDVEAKMIDEAWGGALQSGLMFLGGSIGSRAFNRGHGKSNVGSEGADYAAIRRQAEMMSLEQGVEYKSMQDRGWIDADGKWTEHAPEVVRQNNIPDLGVAPTAAVDENVVHDSASRAHSEVQLNGHTHGVAAYGKGARAGFYLCGPCSQLALKLEQLEHILPPDSDLAHDVRLFRRKVQQLDEKVANGTMSEADADIKAAEMAGELRRYAGKDPFVERVLEMPVEDLEMHRDVLKSEAAKSPALNDTVEGRATRADQAAIDKRNADRNANRRRGVDPDADADIEQTMPTATSSKAGKTAKSTAPPDDPTKFDVSSNIDEIKPVGGKAPLAERRRRALDLDNRELKDAPTNQKTKWTREDPRDESRLGKPRKPVSLRMEEKVGGKTVTKSNDEYLALWSRRFSEITEIKVIGERIIADMKGKTSRAPGDLKAELNSRLWDEFRNPTTEEGRIVAEAFQRSGWGLVEVDGASVLRQLTVGELVSRGYSFVDGQGWIKVSP